MFESPCGMLLNNIILGMNTAHLKMEFLFRLIFLQVDSNRNYVFTIRFVYNILSSC